MIELAPAPALIGHAASAACVGCSALAAIQRAALVGDGSAGGTQLRTGVLSAPALAHHAT